MVLVIYLVIFMWEMQMKYFTECQLVLYLAGYPVGVLTNMTEEVLRSYHCTPYYDRPYSHPTTSTDIMTTCSQCDIVFMGCRPENDRHGYIPRITIQP